MIPEQNPYNNWNGNGSTTTFDFDFYIENETQLDVFITNAQGVQTKLEYGLDYSINEFKNENGSFITFPLAGSSHGVLAADEIISLCLTLPISQENPYGKSSYLDLTTLEYSLDYLTRICQIMNRELERSVKVQEGANNTPDDLIESLNQAQINAENSANFAAMKAQEASNSAIEAEEQAEIATQKVVEIAELHETVIANITQKKSDAVLNIQQELQTAEDTIIESKNIALENIESTKTSSISEINNSANTTKTDILNQINSGKETAISEIQNVSDTEKIELQSYVDEVDTYKNIAVTKANEASTSAQQALASENECTTKEQSVTQKTTEALNSISSSQTTAVNAVNSAKTTAINSVNSLVNKAEIWAEGTDEEIQTIGGERSAKGWAEYAKGQASGANQNLSNLSEVGEDRLNVSKMYETGAVSEDVKGFEELLKRAHSSFDKSKFSVVGNAVVSNDGIANAFDTSSVIKSKELTFTPQESLIFKCAFTTGDNVNTIQYVFRFYNNLTGNFITNAIYIENGYIKALGADNANASVLKVEPNSTYYAELIWTKDLGYYVGRCSTNNIDFTEAPITSAKTPMQGNNSVIWIGNAQDTNLIRPFLGSIDLKSVAVWVDGVPLFNGNKTGLEIIKPDNYEVVGSPTISEDGILSKTGADASNYVKMPFNDIDLEDWEIDFIFDFLNQNGNARLIGDISLSALQIYFSKYGLDTTIYGASSNVSVPKPLDTIHQIGKYYGFIKRNDGKYTVGYKRSDESDYHTSSVESAVTPVKNIITLLYQTDANSDFQIDLNSIKIYSKGKLVYQPCLKIPYTEAFEHSRIVDVAYRNRVQDLAEQKGEALFYTIDEQNKNFTAPSADIYGMITKNREIAEHADLATAKAYIVETYRNGNSWYRVWSDGWIEQGGRSNAGVGTDLKTINLLKKFDSSYYTVIMLPSTGVANSDYNNGLSIVGRYTSYFTYYNGDATVTSNPSWIAFGYSE